MSARERPAPGDVLEPVSPEHLAKLADDAAREKSAGNAGPSNLLRYISENAPDEVAALLAEREGLVARVLDLNVRIAQLQTHALVSPRGAA